MLSLVHNRLTDRPSERASGRADERADEWRMEIVVVSGSYLLSGWQSSYLCGGMRARRSKRVFDPLAAGCFSVSLDKVSDATIHCWSRHRRAAPRRDAAICRVVSLPEELESFPLWKTLLAAGLDNDPVPGSGHEVMKITPHPRMRGNSSWSVISIGVIGVSHRGSQIVYLWTSRTPAQRGCRPLVGSKRKGTEGQRIRNQPGRCADRSVARLRSRSRSRRRRRRISRMLTVACPSGAYLVSALNERTMH